MPFTRLPVEILEEIFCYIDILTLTLHIPLACRLFRNIMQKASATSMNPRLRCMTRDAFRVGLEPKLQLPSTPHPILEVLQLRKRVYGRRERDLTVNDIGVFGPKGKFITLRNTPFAKENATSPPRHILTLELRWPLSGVNNIGEESTGEKYQMLNGYNKSPWPVSVFDAAEAIAEMVRSELEFNHIARSGSGRIFIAPGETGLLSITNLKSTIIELPNKAWANEFHLDIDVQLCRSLETVEPKPERSSRRAKGRGRIRS